MAARNFSRFQRGFPGMKGGVYKCGCCGRMTRDTGNDEAGVGLCRFCNDEALLENSFSDGHITEEQYNAELAKIDAARKKADAKKKGVE